MSPPLVVWDPRMLDYDFGGNHPLDPLRWELTWLLAKSLGVIDSYEVFAPSPAGVETLGLIHAPGYIDAVRRASRTGVRIAVGHGLGTPDTPIFPGIHESAALIAGGLSWWSVPVPPGTPSKRSPTCCAGSIRCCGAGAITFGTGCPLGPSAIWTTSPSGGCSGGWPSGTSG